MIIGITGLAGSGKDAVAALLAMQGYVRYAFADELRREAQAFITAIRDRKEYGISKEDLTSALVAYNYEINSAIWKGEITPEMVWAKPTPPFIRELLQRHGTEFRRTRDPNYWVGLLMKQIQTNRAMYIDECTNAGRSVKNEKVTISDVRFPNEAEAIHNRGGKIWRVVRPGVEPVAAHSSESGQAEITVDAELLNDGTLYNLALKVRALL